MRVRRLVKFWTSLADPAKPDLLAQGLARKPADALVWLLIALRFVNPTQIVGRAKQEAVR